jgi:superfamily I DNA/RNA helicase
MTQAEEEEADRTDAIFIGSIHQSKGLEFKQGTHPNGGIFNKTGAGKIKRTIADSSRRLYSSFG